MGRNKYSPRRVIEHSACVRIQDLKNYGILNKGALKAHWNYSITQTRGMCTEKLADVTFTVQILDTERLSKKNFIQFEYDYQGQHFLFKQPIEVQPVNLGGYRYFFRCDCIKNGHYCGRRVKALYFGGTVWACRHCLELVYNNCRYHRHEGVRFRNHAEVLQSKANILRQYGHPRKANLLDWKASIVEMQAEMAFMDRMSMILKRVYRK